MELLTVKETADLLRVSTVTVRRYIASGKLAAVRVGRNIRIRRQDVEEAIQPEVIDVDPRFADKSDEWLLENHPLMKSIGFIKDDGPTDIAENHNKYLAEAYADTHEEEAVEPVVIDVDPRFADKSDEWLLENHPWMKMLGIGSDREGKTDIAENHDYYLAEAHSDMHEE